MTWKVHLDSLIRWGTTGYKMYVIRENHDQSMDVMRGATMEHAEPNASISMDHHFLSDDMPGNDVKSFLQAMSDAAWEIGIKPKQIEDNSNELKATKYHLEDMRRLTGVDRKFDLSSQFQQPVPRKIDE